MILLNKDPDDCCSGAIRSAPAAGDVQATDSIVNLVPDFIVPMDFIDTHNVTIITQVVQY